MKNRDTINTGSVDYARQQTGASIVIKIRDQKNISLPHLFFEIDGFAYGRSVTDWKIPECDVVAGWSRDFWCMTESEMEMAEIPTPEMAMPGSWVF